jgi:DNA-binding transcriptional ArsR family regulator
MEEIEIRFGEIASLLGDKARSLMLWNLLDGRAYTATELSLCADVSVQSASNHLAKLTNANILIAEKQGRHRYYRYANEEVAQVIESMASLLPLSHDFKKREKQELFGVKYARTCYDHLAGRVAVAITDSLIKNRIIEADERNYAITPIGDAWFESIGLNTKEIKLQKRSFAHPCLDWTERRHHLAGALGASLLQTMLDADWIRRKKKSREVIITLTGKIELKKMLNLDV